MEMSIVTGIIERKIFFLFSFSSKAKGTLGKSQVVLSQVDQRRDALSPIRLPLFRKWMELLKRTGLRFPWFSSMQRSSRSRWFPSGPLRREGKETYSTRPLHCSPDILLTFELKFNGTHIPYPIASGNDRN